MVINNDAKQQKISQKLGAFLYHNFGTTFLDDTFKTLHGPIFSNREKFQTERSFRC